MKIQIATQAKENPPIKYPCLMVSEEKRIVLFHEEKSGILFSDPSGFHPVGYYSNLWVMDSFTPLPTDQIVTVNFQNEN